MSTILIKPQHLDGRNKLFQFVDNVTGHKVIIDNDTLESIVDDGASITLRFALQSNQVGNNLDPLSVELTGTEAADFRQYAYSFLAASFQGDFGYDAEEEPQPFGSLFGDLDTISLTTSQDPLVNWTNGTSQGNIDVDQVAGTITVLEDGLYSLEGWIIGDETTLEKDEETYLYLDIDSTPFRVAVTPTSNKTSGQDFVFIAKRQIPAGTVLGLKMSWSENKNTGNFDFAEAQFTVALLRRGAGI